MFAIYDSIAASFFIVVFFSIHPDNCDMLWTSRDTFADEPVRYRAYRIAADNFCYSGFVFDETDSIMVSGVTYLPSLLVM